MRNKIEINLEQLKRNIDIVQNHLPKGTEIIAVVKANAYGHGDIAISTYLEKECSVKMFAVAGLDEALKLREGGIKGDILVLSYVQPEDLKTAFDNHITISLISPKHAIEISKAAQKLGITADVHLALNTGMNRIGFDCKTFKQMMTISGVYKLPNLHFTGIFSHFSSSDDLSKGAVPYTKLQLDRFEKVLAYLSERGINPGLRHIANSGAIGKYDGTAFDAVRCGALMYGYNTALDAKLPVKPIMKWETTIYSTRTLEFGDAVSYSRKYVASEEARIATLGIGYADGLP
ncbi:MAG: alanine racemase, partial [Bacillota bacterium]|nr:alanine racemase [Bacillota bacterium]